MEPESNWRLTIEFPGTLTDADDIAHHIVEWIRGNGFPCVSVDTQNLTTGKPEPSIGWVDLNF